MAKEYIEREALLAEIENEYKNVEKIKTSFAKIIVDGTAEKPYYSILWLDNKNKGYNVGYSSYCLDYVFKWLEVVFEFIQADEAPADVVEVAHDKKRKQIAERLKDYHDRNTPGDYKTSIFGVAALLLEQDASAERQGHWIGLEYDGYADGCPVYDLWECSECGEEVSGEDVPETHLFCHGCGARMDGE